jgi:Ca-activated chloride channel family protein
MNDARFHHLESLHWLWLVLGLALLIVYAVRARRIAWERFAVRSLWDRLMPQANLGRHVMRGALIVSAAALIVIALLDPRWGVRYETMQRRGIDILFVVDVSRSMLAEDVAPNRLDRAKQYIEDVIEDLGGDRVGLISFAGVSALKCPLTIDYGALRLTLNELAAESAARGGSLLGDALRLAGNSFTDDATDARVVIILSDGEDHDSYPLDAARALHEETGARLFTVGIGDSNDGARIPVTSPNAAGSRAFLTYQGQEVWSKMNAAVLRDIALAGGGAFVPAGTAQVDLAEVYRERIAPMSTRELESGRIEVHNAQYQWFAGLAFILLLAESWMGAGSPRRIEARNEGSEQS